MNDDIVVQTFGVGREFPVGSDIVHAVQDVSLTVRRGEFVGLIGRSGSGKTTLLNIIAGLDRPTSGRVESDGEEITTYGERQLTDLRRHKIGFVFQSFGLLPLLSATENVEIALRIAGAGLRERRRRSAELMEMVGLAGRAHHRPYELSGGEQQRVAIARSLANNPALVLADEPTGELDSSTAVSIFSLLRTLVENHGITIITTTHDRTVMELVPRIEEMRDGHLLSSADQELLAYTTREERSHFASELPAGVQEDVSATLLREPEIRHVVHHRELPTQIEPNPQLPEEVRWSPQRTDSDSASPAMEQSAEKRTRPEASQPRPPTEKKPTPQPPSEPDFKPPAEDERPDWARRN